MRIGCLAEATGTPVETIRFHEREGLLPPARRSANNYREYAPAHVERLAFIRQCRNLDMTLDEVRSLLTLRDSPSQGCREINALLDEHIGQVARRVRELRVLDRGPEGTAGPVRVAARDGRMRHPERTRQRYFGHPLRPATTPRARGALTSSLGRLRSFANAQRGDTAHRDACPANRCATARLTSTHSRRRRYTPFGMNSRPALPRCVTSLFLVMSLLFSQLALANYVCPGEGNAVPMPEVMASGMPCDGMDSSAPVLCHQYAADASQSFEMAKVATPTVPMVVQVLVLPLLLDSARAASLPFSDRPEARPPPDPVFLQTLRLRV
ncbi:MAG: Cd(II)/Pb(II)-responsive transcriptional regulator [Ilumatobacteraceae bacterium]|nr:Cd(II)/Pb(II)-responsive transcriptional regulator [Ilumatobacteraceae bacterium]